MIGDPLAFKVVALISVARGTVLSAHMLAIFENLREQLTAPNCFEKPALEAMTLLYEGAEQPPV